MNHTVLKVHQADNIIVALTDLQAGQTVFLNDESYVLKDNIDAKHKFAAHDFEVGSPIIMYGVLVGKAVVPILRGGLIHTQNIHHAAENFGLGSRKTDWNKPDVSAWKDRTFMGYHRSDGLVGTANYWIVIPMVFCENRNLDVMKQALVSQLGYGKSDPYTEYASKLANYIRAGGSISDQNADYIEVLDVPSASARVFENVDGVKFLSHHLGCGGTRQDSQALCALLAGYITNPNVAGATVLSLGCQNAQVSILQEEIAKRSPGFDKPLLIFEQQKYGTEKQLISQAIRQTIAGMAQANQATRQPAPLSKLIVGLECGGSDGFSGISANPAIGYTSDLLVALGASVVLAEFPELCGVEQELTDRCHDEPTASRFIELMRVYAKRADEAGSGFDMNPSPGNIRDGLITDAIKSAGAAKKGGSSPVADVLDYTEPVRKPGLTLLCTPGNDVESTTAEAGSGCNMILFTTGLGTPTGNPIVPVIKLSTNTKMAQKMHDIIDIDTGNIIDGSCTIEQKGIEILEYLIEAASGNIVPKAVMLGQDDFIPWKRGVSL